MGTDCDLLFGFEKGIKQISLDRAYTFSRIEMNRWLKREKLQEQLENSIDLKNNTRYDCHWLAYAKACVENLFLDEELRFVAIVDENQALIDHLNDAREQARMDYGTRELIPFKDAKYYLK